MGGCYLRHLLQYLRQSHCARGDRLEILHRVYRRPYVFRAYGLFLLPGDQWV